MEKMAQPTLTLQDLRNYFTANKWWELVDLLGKYEVLWHECWQQPENQREQFFIEKCLPAFHLFQLVWQFNEWKAFKQ